MSKENKIRIVESGKIISVNESIYNDAQKLEWLGAERLEQPKKATGAPSTKKETKPEEPQEKEQVGDLPESVDPKSYKKGELVEIAQELGLDIDFKVNKEILAEAINTELLNRA